MNIPCECPACNASEEAKSDINLPYRYTPGQGLNIFHLALHFSAPVIGAILIGYSGLALLPFAGFMAAYLANSFLGCSSCPYHHSNVKTCGCFPKSIFNYKRFKPWDNTDNTIVWSLVLILLTVPTFSVLIIRGDTKSIAIFSLYALFALVSMSTFSCPNCRQRSICYLGRLTFLIRNKQKQKSC